MDNRTPFYRPPLPQQESEGVHPGILTLMKQCWAEEPTERPSFVYVAKAVKNVNNGRSYFSIPGNFFRTYSYCLSNAMHSIGQTITNKLR